MSAKAIDIFVARNCDVCRRRPARLFVIVSDDSRRVKVQVCLHCFELAQERGCASVEEISFREWKEVEESV